MKQVKRILCITILLLIVIGTMISTYATNYAFFAYDDEGVYRALKLENSISPYFYYYNTHSTSKCLFSSSSFNKLH